MFLKVEPRPVALGLAISVVGPLLIGFVLIFIVGFAAALMGQSARLHAFLSDSNSLIAFLLITAIVNFGAGMVVGKVASQSPTRQGIAVGVLTTVAFVAFALSGIRPPGSGRSGGSGAIPPLVFLFPVLWICAPALGAKVVGGWRVRRGTSGDAGEFAAVVDDKASAAGKP